MLRRLWYWILNLVGVRRHVSLPATIKTSVEKE